MMTVKILYLAAISVQVQLNVMIAGTTSLNGRRDPACELRRALTAITRAASTCLPAGEKLRIARSACGNSDRNPDKPLVALDDSETLQMRA